MKSRRTSEKSGTRSPGPKNSSSGDKIFGHGLKVGRRHGIASRTGLSIANASQHLQQMRRGGLVVARREGKFVRYRLSDNSVLDLVAALRTIAEQHLAEVDRIVRSYLRNRDDLEAVSRKELMRRLKDCVLSFEAVARLRACGFKARPLEDGLPEWRAAGLPVETSEAPQ